jgi:TPR repeat protein
MKLKWVACVLLMLIAVAMRLPAQQGDADRKLFEDTKAKAEKGDAEAQFTVGWDYETGMGVERDKVEAVKWYRKAAEQNNAGAQFNLAHCYADGQGVAKNEVEAVKWYRKAAEQNLAQAQCNLGACYRDGQGVVKDEVEAVKWLRKAAEQNDARGQANLGICYDYGKGVAMDYVEAVKWYRKAAEQNLAQPQYNLGTCYASGRGVAEDDVEAVKWYRKAAEQNYAEAQFNLGGCYRDGKGVAKDEVEAVKWYRKAADQNFAPAEYNLGVCYNYGAGVPRDYVEAYKWINLASAQGDEDAKKWLSVIEQRMTPEQIGEAQRRSSAFVPRKETPTSSFDNSTSPANPTVTGTGFFITDDGYLISNNHVVKDATKVRLLTGAGLINATVVKVDAANDLALLKAVGRFAPLPIAASRTVKLGGTVATVGFPDIGLQGFAPKLAKGEIASLSGSQDDPRYFQISLPVQPGNSGGALVDARGNVVGIVAAKLSARAALDATGSLPENVNYAVKSSLLLSFLESVPDVASKLKEPNAKDEPFEDLVKSAQDAAVLVLVY